MKKTITLFILLFTLSLGQMWGETIPAGTIIYVDVTNFHSDKSGYATDGKYYMSVTASYNVDKPVNKSNTSGANWDNGYDARKDTEWQELTRLATNFYAGVVEKESTVGSVSFWRKELSSSDHLWEVDACTPNMWNSKERKFTITSGYTHHDDRYVAGFSATTSMGLYTPGATLYLKVDSRWKTGNPRFAACFKRYGGEQWVDCSQVGESDYYSVTVPEGEWPYVIYCRMNPAESENGWDEEGHDRVWDQTSDIFAQHDRNLCVINTVDNETWSYHQYTWVYAPTPIIVGAMNDWTVLKGYPMTDGSVSLSLNADAAYPFQVVSVESWYGYGDTGHSLTFAGQTASQALTADKKDVLLLTAGADEYTFTWNEGTKTLSVSHPTVTHPNPNYVYYKNTKGWTNVYAHIYGTQATVFPGPQLSSCTFNDVPYYYVALGNNANVVFNQGNSTNQDDLTNIASNKGKYYDPSTTLWKYFSATIELNNQSATSAGTENVAVEVFNTALTSTITCPSKTGYLFGGYWTEEDGNGVQLINYQGAWIASVDGYTDENKKWIHEGGTATLYAKWTDMLQLYPETAGEFEDKVLDGWDSYAKALFINSAKFADAHPGNRIKISGFGVTDGAKLFFGDYDVNHVPGSDFREVSSLPVYIYLTQDMIDYIKTHDLRIYGQNMTVNRVELEVGRADKYGSQPQRVIWMGDYSANDLNTLNICIKGLDDVTWSDYANLIIYHNAGTKDYSFNVRTNWEESGIISYWNGKNHITQEKNFTVVDFSDASKVIGATPDRLLIQRDDHAEDDRTSFTITSIVLEKSNAATGSTWSGATWSQGHAPTTDECAVITAPMTVDVNHAIAGRVVIDQNGHTGQLTIRPNKGLDVRLTVKKTTDGSTLTNTTPADLVLESSSDGNASLIFENDENQATVQMYSKATIGENWNWQFMGIPFTTTKANPSYYGSYLYEWQSSGAWGEVANGGTMTAFTGYCITQDEPTTYVMDGELNPTTSHKWTIPADKEFVMANSWTAPIYVGAITDEALAVEKKNIYLFNTGHSSESAAGEAKERYEAGTYLTLPIHSASYTGDSLIAPMQGFYVDNTGGDAGTVTLDYATVVRPAGLRNILAGAMHAPKRTQEQQPDNRPTVLKLWANGAMYNDRVVVLERSDFSTGFDNGWDGKKLSFGEMGPSVYVINALGEPEAVSAIPDFEGTVVGFRAGTNNTCTMTFEYDGDETFYINDLQAQQSALIDNESTYTFATDASDDEARFVISATPIAKAPTGVDTVTDNRSPLTRKILLNDHIYIIREGRMFSMDGRLVK